MKKSKQKPIKREPNPNLKRLNYKFVNKIEVNDAEIITSKLA